jgi:hypothetical protein
LIAQSAAAIADIVHCCCCFCSPYIDNVTVSHEQLLAQSLQDFGLEKYREYQRLADQGWLRLRISETNSL